MNSFQPITMTKTADIFEQHRPDLFRLAYGMLGRVAPAEDAVQEAFLRWQKQNPEQIRSPKAWLSKVVSRICLDEIKSARNRREQYIGPDLPEPLLTSGESPPDEKMELAESLSLALLMLLDELTPVERAVFLLREVFDYDYGSVSDIIQKSEANCRKIAQRARDHLREKRPGFERKPEIHHQLVNSFIEAIKDGNLSQMESLLAEEAILYSDGGGKVTAARKPVAGAKKIAKFMVGIQKGIPASTNWWTEYREVNGEPGMLVWMEGELNNVWSFHVEKGKIRSIYVVLNPDKLEHLKK